MTMTGLGALQSVQFVSRRDKRLAVLDATESETLIEWLETLEDIHVAKQALAELRAAGDRGRAGWLEWDSVVGELS